MSRLFDSSQVGGSANYITIADNPAFANLAAWTVMAWILPLNYGGNGAGSRIYNAATMCVKAPESGYNMFLSIENGNDGITNIVKAICGVNDTRNVEAYSVAADNTAVLNSWYHVANTWDSNTDELVKCYINGVQVLSYKNQIAGSGTPFSDSPGLMYIGNDTFDDGFGGYIAYFRTWSSALSQADIQSAMNRGNPQPATAAINMPLAGTQSPEPNIGIGDAGILSANPPTGSALDPFTGGTVANSLNTNPIVLTGVSGSYKAATAAVQGTLNTLLVKKIVWEAPTTAADQVHIIDPTGRTLYQQISPSTGVGDSQDFSARPLMWTDFSVIQLDSGTLFIYLA